tara:strand:- start:862 stop:1146 length:285 start_codon:yes stop_codon:yes gene_type:complete
MSEITKEVIRGKEYEMEIQATDVTAVVIAHNETGKEIIDRDVNLVDAWYDLHAASTVDYNDDRESEKECDYLLETLDMLVYDKYGEDYYFIGAK